METLKVKFGVIPIEVLFVLVIDWSESIL